jgi:hypothetical protein
MSNSVPGAHNQSAPTQSPPSRKAKNLTNSTAARGFTSCEGMGTMRVMKLLGERKGVQGGGRTKVMETPGCPGGWGGERFLQWRWCEVGEQHSSEVSNSIPSKGFNSEKKTGRLSSQDQATVRHRISGKPLVTHFGRTHTTITALQRNLAGLAIFGE